ncbi:Adenylosuccinate lyase [Citrifermentans bremense]|uniref:Adenylosuccinate lyase n=2 Tax=Geobacteraceae TaxID=213422 RepID=A0ABQ0MGG8_9BACT|nr:MULTISPECIES: adenylosuccinate lyase [Geobacteraceae]BCG47437.1 Adenylosuccinate lyase [Citrifermentans bremense]GAW66187.1 adenylosuccinate lyase [Geoanaerobacter pelophilus]
MIERYSRPEMARIWEPENRYRKWLEIEIYACEAHAEMGRIPKDAVARIKAKANFDVPRIDEIERTVKHDVIAFLTSVADYIGEDSRFVHLGLTSSDVLDTSFAMLLKEAGELILADIKRLMAVIKTRAYEHKMTPQMGRSHGIHAEPVTFGLKMALWYDEMARNLKRMEAALETISYGKLSGAVGTFANIDPQVEDYVCKKAGLKPAPCSTQVLQRDRHAEYFTTLAIIASSIEKFAVEIRHLQRTEVLEAEEFFSKGQKGSSAMPHKRNPVLSENLTGLARLIRGYSVSAMENVPLWHERDISHSSVERIIGPDATVMLDFMLNRAIGLIENLVVYPENMMRNLNQMRGLIFSQRVLLKLAESGASREKAYALVQRNAMKVWEEGKDFQTELLNDPEVAGFLPAEEIKEAFDLGYHLKHVDTIFTRVFGG